MSRILSKADLEPRQEPEEKIVSLLPPNDIDVDYDSLHVVTAARNECDVLLGGNEVAVVTWTMLFQHTAQFFWTQYV